MKIIFLVLLLCVLPSLSSAEQLLESGDFRLHYIAMVSTELTPEIARSYGITRSRKKGILVLNLQHAENPLKSYPSQASGRIRNLIGQERLGELRQVQEQDAIYWIADFSFSHLETMRFDFQVTPEGNASAIELKFSQQFYTPGR